MSDKDQIDDGVDIPEAAPEDFSSRQSGRRLTPAVKFGIVIVCIFAVIIISMITGSREIADPTSSVRVNADLDGTPGGAIQSESPRYQELLEQSNDLAAEAAAREGRTFIPTPERVLQPIEDLEAGSKVEDSVEEPAPEPETVAPAPKPKPVAVKAPPAPAPVAPRPAPSVPKTTEQQENPYSASMLSQMSALAPKVARPSIRIVDTGVADAVDRRMDESAAAPENAGTDLPVQEQELIVPAGEIYYAETLTSTNSDLAGSPVLVELTTGEYRGARLIGEFTVNDASDSMIIQFTSMTLPDGRSMEVSAYAVDGMSAEAAVASDVERRYLKRYGPILASAFITSYAQAMSEPEQTLTTVGGETAVIQQPRSVDEALYAGLGAAAGAIGADLVASAPKGPKIILRDGWPIAVMFTAPVVAGS